MTGEAGGGKKHEIFDSWRDVPVLNVFRLRCRYAQNERKREVEGSLSKDVRRAPDCV